MHGYVAGRAEKEQGLPLAGRIVVEEQRLRRALAGYNASTERVRYRLIPFVW